MSSATLTASETTCFHCGEPCAEELHLSKGNSFCCTGCKLVYEILSENGLTNYYCLASRPGQSLKNRRSGRYDYLDEEGVEGRLIDFTDGELTTVRLHIPAIHCASCIWLLENLYKLHDGIVRSSVDFLKRELHLTYRKSGVSLREIAELLESIGYPPEFSVDNLENKPRRTPDRRLWLKLGVAGFAFGNIMLFSLPEYLSGFSMGERSLQLLFGILNIALSLPVLLYSSSDYLRSGWAAIRQGGINLDVPISIGIIALFGRSVYEIASGTGPGYLDSFTGLIFFLLIGRILQNKTFDRLSFDRDYRSYLPISVTVLDEEGGERSVSLKRLKKGSTLLIRHQEIVPTDSVLLSDEAMIDYSFITGESDPVVVTHGETVYAGGRVTGRPATMNTYKEVSGSYLTKLWNDSAFDSERPGITLTTMADRISPWFTLAVISIAILSALWWWPSGGGVAASVFTAVLIIACPCALALSTPFTLGSALNHLARNGLYVKNTLLIEQLARVTTLVFDKTGTLTDPRKSELHYEGTPLSPSQRILIASACRSSLHPVSRQIFRQMDASTIIEPDTFEEQLNRGIVATVGPHRIVVGSAHLLAEEGIALPEEAGAGSHRTHLAIDTVWIGGFEQIQHFRKGVPELIARLKTKFPVWLLSGDNDRQKKRLAATLDEERMLFDRIPHQKLDFIRRLQSEGHNVMMIGDGLNDAGALKQSDFGIALTHDVTSFTPACSAIMDASRMDRLDRFIRFAGRSLTIIRMSFGLSLAYNTIGLSFAVTGTLTPLVAAILMPLSSLSIIAFTTGSTWLAARKEGFDLWNGSSGEEPSRPAFALEPGV